MFGADHSRRASKFWGEGLSLSGNGRRFQYLFVWAPCLLIDNPTAYD
jgi:hypothetical protein